MSSVLRNLSWNLLKLDDIEEENSGQASKSLQVCGLFCVSLNKYQQLNQTWCCAFWEYPHKRGAACAFGQWKPRKATAAAASSGISGAAWASCLCFCPALWIPVCCCTQSWDPLPGWGFFMVAGFFSACMEIHSNSLQRNRTALLEHLCLLTWWEWPVKLLACTQFLQ